MRQAYLEDQAPASTQSTKLPVADGSVHFSHETIARYISRAGDEQGRRGGASALRDRLPLTDIGGRIIFEKLVHWILFSTVFVFYNPCHVASSQATLPARQKRHPFP